MHFRTIALPKRVAVNGALPQQYRRMSKYDTLFILK
jgi:hypothetical protein